MIQQKYASFAFLAICIFVYNADFCAAHQNEIAM